MKWQEGNWAVSESLFVNESGKIIGSIAQLGWYQNRWVARLGERRLGEYVDAASAKKAVENAARGGA